MGGNPDKEFQVLVAPLKALRVFSELLLCEFPLGKIVGAHRNTDDSSVSGKDRIDDNIMPFSITVLFKFYRPF